MTSTTPVIRDARPRRSRSCNAARSSRLSVQAVANYIAKYATKTLEATGLPDRPVRVMAEVEQLRCSRHHKQMMTTALQLAGHHRDTGHRLRRSAHTLGWGGHFLTKSRCYSTTFGALRRARQEHRKRARYPDGETDPWGRPLDETIVLIIKTWNYHGTEHNQTGAEMALASAARARDH